MGRDDNDRLFNNKTLSDVIPAQESTALTAVDSYDQNSLLEMPIDDFVTKLHEKYRINPIILDESAIQVEERETQMDVSRDPMRAISDRSRPFNIAASAITFIVPYTGDQELFALQPSTFTLNPPRGKVFRGGLHITYVAQSHDSQKLRTQFDQDLSKIKTYVGYQRGDIDSFNTQLTSKLRQRIEARRQKIANDQSAASSLGFPMKRRDTP